MAKVPRRRLEFLAIATTSAAILEYDAGLPRARAQDIAAQAHGFADWAAYIFGMDGTDD